MIAQLIAALGSPPPEFLLGMKKEERIFGTSRVCFCASIYCFCDIILNSVRELVGPCIYPTRPDTGSSRDEVRG